jgi:hypothetical protein
VSGFDVIDYLIRKPPEMLHRTVVATAFPKQLNDGTVLIAGGYSY